MTKKGRPRQTFRSLGLLVTTLIVALVISEILVRLCVPMEKVTLVSDPRLGVRGRPNLTTLWNREVAGTPITVHTNEGGFHDLPREREKDPGTLRVMFLGDSFLEAFQVPLESNYCSLLEKSCRSESGSSWECINMGVHTYGLGSYLLMLDQIGAWSPDAVVVCVFLGNDLFDNFFQTASPALPTFRLVGGDLVEIPPRTSSGFGRLRDDGLARSALARFVWLRVVHGDEGVASLARRLGLVASPEPDVSARTVPEALAVSERMLQEMRRKLPPSTPLFFFLIPDPVRINQLAGRTRTPRPLAEQRAARIEAGLIPFLDREGFDFVYPRQVFTEAVNAGEELYLNGLGHFSERGHQLAEAVLAPRLLALSPDARQSHDTASPIATRP